MKVSVAHLVNPHIGDAADLVSLLAGDQNGSFASLLGLGGSEPDIAPPIDGGRAREGHRSKEKQSGEDESVPGDSKPNAPLNPLGLPHIPSLSVAPWQLELGSSGARGHANDVSPSPSLDEERNGPIVGLRQSAAKAPIVEAGQLNHQKSLNENAAEITSFHDLNGSESIESPKGAIVTDHDAPTTKALAPLNDEDPSSIAAQPSSATPAVVQPPMTIVGNGVTDLLPVNQADLHFLGISVNQKYATPDREMKSSKVDQDSTMSAGARVSDLPAKDDAGLGKSFAPSQGVDVIGGDSSSAAGGRSQGNAGDTHRGSSDAKGGVAAGQVLAQQTAQSGTLGVLGAGGMTHGHSALMNSSHLQSVRESTPNAQLKELAPPRDGEAAAARLLGSAMRGDLRVGVQTEAFGRVTIQTNAQGGQLSAQLSLENAKESATLAAHLPGVEQKIVQQHGLEASVRLAGAADGGAGGSMGRGHSESGRRDPERYQNDVAVRREMVGHGSPSESRSVEATLLGSRYLVSSRLDVTV